GQQLGPARDAAGAEEMSPTSNLVRGDVRALREGHERDDIVRETAARVAAGSARDGGELLEQPGQAGPADGHGGRLGFATAAQHGRSGGRGWWVRVGHRGRRSSLAGGLAGAWASNHDVPAPWARSWQRRQSDVKSMSNSLPTRS